MKKEGEIKKVLVIRFRRIGDAVLSSAICSSVRKSFPSAEIHFVLNENITALFEHHPDIDRIISFSNEDNSHFFRYISKVWKLVRSEKYDIIVDCRSTIKTSFFCIFSMSTPYRLGLLKKYNLFHNYKSDIRNYRSNVDRMVSLLSPLEKKFKMDYVKDFRLKITEKEIADFKEYMLKQGIDPAKPIIVCTVAARIPRKIWNLDYMAEVLLKIIELLDAQLVFNFSGPELEIAQSVKEKMGNPAQVFLNVEAKTLRELGALLKNSDFFFGNEGGPRHIAQALDIPAYAIYPPGISKTEWLPNASDRFQGIEPGDFLEQSQLQLMAYEDAFNAITPEIVCEKLLPMLDRYLVKVGD